MTRCCFWTSARARGTSCPISPATDTTELSSAGSGPPPNRVPPSLLLAGQNRVELENTAGMLDLNGTFTVEMWVNVAKGIQNFVGDETWPAVNNAVERPRGWVLRI